MSIPSRVVGGGNGNAVKNVFRLTFSTALSSAPDFESYDSTQSFPATDTVTTTGNTVFTGSTVNGSQPFLALITTTAGASTSSWRPSSATAGSTTTTNLMKGTTNYVTDTSTPGAGGIIYWNQDLQVASDLTTSSTFGFDILMRYTYTGSAPSLTWAFNDNVGGGTEGSPVWTTLTPGAHGVRYVNSGTSGGGPYLLNIPTSGTASQGEIWVSAT